MEVKANLKHLRMSAQKVRLVVDVIRRMPVETALDQLKFINKLATGPVTKLIKSAIANAVNTYSLEKNNLYIKEIRSNEGATLKRWRPRAQGRATPIRKRTCHLSLILAEIKVSGNLKKKVLKVAEPVKLEKLVKEGKKTLVKNAPKLDKEKGKKSIGEKTKMFRRKSG